jgi:hypothetical protein
VTNLRNNKTTDIVGKPKSIKGRITDFRDNNLLDIIDDDEN